MLGRSHALSGAVAGLAVGSLALHEPTGQLALLGGLTAAFALAPDIDQCGSTSARSLGFVTEALAWVIAAISGGHRHATHSLAGIGTFTGIAWLACLFRHTWRERGRPGRGGRDVLDRVRSGSRADRRGSRHRNSCCSVSWFGLATGIYHGFGRSAEAF